MAKFRLVRGFLQKLGVVGFAEGGEIVGPVSNEDKVGPFCLPPGSVIINGKDFSQYVRDIEIYPSATQLISHAYHTGALEEILEERRKWEVGQEDTQPITVINPGEEWGDWGDDPITPGGTWPEEMDCE